jgi:glycosyltransferase involved in cell wall biosynthesis
MSVAIIIRAFNEEAHIGRLLTGIREQAEHPEEVIVVDSGSTDATVAIAEAFGATVVPIARDEFSFGRALNRGIEAAETDLIVLVSAHVYPIYDDWLERLLAPFDESDEVGLSYGRQVTPPEGRFSERRLLERWFPAESRIDREQPFCNNANAAIRRDLWLDRPYDEQLTGLEDLAWAKELLATGGALAYVAEAPIVHVHEEPFARIVNRYRREAIAHKAIYPNQSLSAMAALRLGFANIAGDVMAARREGRKLSHEAISILQFRAAQFYGTYAGLSQTCPVTDSLKRRFYYPPGARLPEEPNRPRGRMIDYDEASHWVKAGRIDEH